MKTIADRIAPFRPCSEALEWLGDRTDLAAAYAECPRGDWLFWLHAKCGTDRREVVRAYGAYTAARAAARTSSRQDMHRRCADAVRSILPNPPEVSA